MIRSGLRKLGFVALLGLFAFGAAQGSASAAADGNLDISTLPPQAQARINPGLLKAVQVPSVQVVVADYHFAGK